MATKETNSFLFEWSDHMEFSRFVDSVLSYVYGTMTLGERGRVVGITLGKPNHLKEGFSTRVARIDVESILGKDNHYYVGLSVPHSDLSKWRVDWRSVLLEGKVRPPTEEEIIWISR